MAATSSRPLSPLAVTSRQAAFFRPIIRAYLFGHLSSTGPRLLTALLTLRTRYRHPAALLSKLSSILHKSLATDRFPFFCGHLVALFVALRAVLESAVLRSSVRDARQVRLLLSLSSFAAAAMASWMSLPLLNGPVRSTHDRAHVANGHSGLPDVSVQPSSRSPEKVTKLTPPPARTEVGKTLDLSLLASVRALETVIYHAWHRYLRSQKHVPSRFRQRVETMLASAADPLLFASSAGLVMWAWFYEPHRLPHGYNRWITSAASVDIRLIEALRAARAGTFIYGKEPGAAHILTPMCDDFDWPRVWGDPAKTVPVPCTMVHMGLAGSSCHAYALARFARAFRFAFLMYFPLHLVLRLRTKPHVRTRPKVVAALREASRSSAFLGAFIAFFYYAVCLSRTVIGPRLFARESVSAQAWDSGLCTAAGCGACGWSVLLEPPRRQQELAGFVAPRALATLLPRRYDKAYFNRERAAFALSFGILTAAVRDGPAGVRGVLGGLLHGILK